MEESISGFKVRGEWAKIVEHGERITQALREAGVGADGDQLASQSEAEAEGGDEDKHADGDTDANDHKTDGDNATYTTAFEEWDAWRPKAHETLDSDVSKKTADQASVEEGVGEKAGKGANDDIQTAGQKLSESYEALEEDDAESAMGTWKESIDYVTRAADTASRKALRRVEDTVYQRVMTQLAPYYFDNQLISANIQQSGNGNEAFVFEVNINEDELKDEVSAHLATFEDEIDRWHVEVQKDTETAEAIEGAEPPPEPTDSTRSTTN